MVAEAISGGASAGIDPFGHAGQAQGYAAYRPEYPSQLLASIIHEAKARGLTDDGLLLDIATGTGKVISTLAPHFKSARGFDRSSAQLSCATPGPNIEYAEGDAYATPLPDGSASVITIGQALHWLDINRFAKDCRRLLVPKGFVVVLGYTKCTISGSSTADAELERYMESLDKYWDCDRHLLDREFAGADFSPLVEVKREVAVEQWAMAPSRLVDYLRTWSPYNTYRHRHPTEPDPLVALEAALAAAAAKDGVGEQLTVQFKFFAIYLS